MPKKIENLASLAIACGAALLSEKKPNEVNCRIDYLPFQGRKKRIEKSIKLAAIAAAIVIIALGIYFQLQLAQVRYFHFFTVEITYNMLDKQLNMAQEI